MVMTSVKQKMATFKCFKLVFQQILFKLKSAEKQKV